MNRWHPLANRAAVAVGTGSSAARTRRVIVLGLSAAGALVALHALSQAIDFGVFNLRIQAFNADKHDSVFGVASILAQAAVAAACGWRGSSAKRPRRTWFALAALVAGLVLIRGLTTFNAAILALPVGCVFFLLLWLTRGDDSAVRRTVWAGLALMALSLLLHKWGLAADASSASDYSWAYQITGIVKHGAELAGWMLVATGLTAGAFTSDGVTLRHGARRSRRAPASAPRCEAPVRP